MLACRILPSVAVAAWVSLSGLGSLHHREDQSWQLPPSAGLWLVTASPSPASDWSALRAVPVVVSSITSAASLSLSPHPPGLSPQSLLGSQPRRISSSRWPHQLTSSLWAPASSVSAVSGSAHSSLGPHRDNTRTPAPTLGHWSNLEHHTEDISLSRSQDTVPGPPCPGQGMIPLVAGLTIWSHLSAFLCLHSLVTSQWLSSAVWAEQLTVQSQDCSQPARS